MTNPKGKLCRYQITTKTKPVLWDQSPHNSLSASQGQPSQPINLRISSTHWHVNRTQGLTTTGRHTQFTQGTSLKHLAWVNGDITPLGPIDTCYIRPIYQNWEMQQIYLTQRNKHRLVTKMKRQKKCPKWKNRKNLQKKRTKQNGGTQSIRYRIQNTCYKDAQ